MQIIDCPRNVKRRGKESSRSQQEYRNGHAKLLTYRGRDCFQPREIVHGDFVGEKGSV